MEDSSIQPLVVVGAIVAGSAAISGLMYWFMKQQMGAQFKSAQEQAQLIIEEARREAETIHKDAELRSERKIFQETQKHEKEFQRKRLVSAA